MPSAKTSAYAEASIRVLKGLESVKQRPGMYTRTDSPLHIVQEVLDNAADEALAGFGQRIAVTLHADGSVSVDNDGRDIPFGLRPGQGALAVELLPLTPQHAVGLPAMLPSSPRQPARSCDPWRVTGRQPCATGRGLVDGRLRRGRRQYESGFTDGKSACPAPPLSSGRCRPDVLAQPQRGRAPGGR